jgi:AraC-like DNA-binding protein
MTEHLEVVRAWRTADDERLLWMRGVTTHYRMDPVGEFVIGVASHRAYRLHRGRSSQLVSPGRLVVLDPSTSHSGSPAGRAPWAGRLLVAELPDLEAAVADEDGHALFDAGFDDPLVGDGQLASRFAAVHRDMARGASTLERQSQLVAFLDDVAAAGPAANRRTRRVTRDDPAVRRALDRLRGDPTRNISLAELAMVAGTTRSRLVRLFKAAFGVPPHAFQIGQRVMLARRLLERGVRATDVAPAAGFTDQSHLHRHFRRRLGLTPTQYARAVGR